MNSKLGIVDPKEIIASKPESDSRDARWHVSKNLIVILSPTGLRGLPFTISL